MDLWAHSRSDVSGHRHGLNEHCRSTAWWAGWFASAFGMGELAYALGLFHDAGKAACAWQARLLLVEASGGRVGVPHKEVGARLVSGPAGLAALAVLGHHGGMTSRGALLAVLREQDDDEPATSARYLFEVPEASGALVRQGLFPSRWRKVKDKLVWEMRLRLVFSALVDADHLDTAAHRRGLPGPVVAAPVDMGQLAARFEQRRADQLRGHAPGEMGALRSQVYAAAVAAAEHGPGLFRLAAPTGLGKTFAQAGFGLHHAARWGKSRVIVAVPFITITEQNSQIYRDLLDDEDEPVVLEHHSSVRFATDEDDQGTEPNERQQWGRLAAENWDAPFVVTTTVQLFESLFGHRPSQVRKVHRLANAVVILDEVQALPREMLLPILSGLRTLCEHFGTTVLLTSATQPEFQALSVWSTSAEGRAVEITEVIPEPQPLFDQARRVDYEWRLDPKPSWEEIADEVAREEQALVIVNSVADARNLYRLMVERRAQVWHLSARMCPAHRRAVLEVVTDRLARGAPTVVVSTPLVEAGVDLSFPVVWRALAPADSLQQAGGRANRHGEHSRGRVIIFDPEDGHQPQDYSIPCGITVRRFGPDGPKLDDQRVLARYYAELYGDLQLDRQVMNQARRPVGREIQENREALDFRAVADGPTGDTGKRIRHRAFRMIADDTVPVVVAGHECDAKVEATLGALAAGTATAGTALRKLQPWIVQLPAYIATSPAAAALIEPVVGDLGRWRGTYEWDRSTGCGVGLDETAFDTVV